MTKSIRLLFKSPKREGEPTNDVYAELLSALNLTDENYYKDVKERLWEILGIDEKPDHLAKENKPIIGRNIASNAEMVLTDKEYKLLRSKLGLLDDSTKKDLERSIVEKAKEIHSAVSENWTTEELEAAVVAYIDMRRKEADGQPFTKKSYYVALSEKFGRTEKSYEYRMQNISYVYSLMGRKWVTGLKPAKNVGDRVAGELEALINKAEGQALPPIAEFQSRVNALRQKKNTLQPKGNNKPNKKSAEVTQYNRDPEVVAWVLNEANGICESCSNSAPFSKEDGTPFLEVHHMRRLADGGSDTTTNAIAACPNCHRELHYSADRLPLLNSIYSKVGRLIAE